MTNETICPHCGRDNTGHENEPCSTYCPSMLPPDPEGMNDDRAEWAREAMDVFMRRTGTDKEDAIADLVCDLIHLCDRDSDFAKNGCWEDIFGHAEKLYEEETTAI